MRRKKCPALTPTCGPCAFVTRLCRSKSTQLNVTVYLQVGIHKEIWKLKGIKMPLLNNENRARALRMLECGISQNDVARRFSVSRSTIARLVQRVNTTGSLSDRPRSGAPRVMSVRQDVFYPSTSPTWSLYNVTIDVFCCRRISWTDCEQKPC